MYLIDTNIFLEILLEQDKADQCENLLKDIKKSKHNFYVSSFTIHSIEVIMARNKKIKQLSDFLSFLIKSNIQRIDTNTKDELNVLNVMGKSNLDFDDAIQLYLCQKNNLKIISYDQHFDQTQISRIEPDSSNQII